MSVLCVIPARYASTRLPGKPLVDLGGKSLIRRVYETVIEADCFDEVIVATDDRRIYEHVEGFGGVVEMTDEDHSSGTERCCEVAKRHIEYDYVVNVQGDEPDIDAGLLRSVVDELMFGEHQGIVTGVTPLSVENASNPNRVKVVLNWAAFAITFSRSAIPYLRHSEQRVDYLQHIGIYGFRNSLLPQLTEYPMCDLERMEGLEQLRWLYYGHQIKCLVGDWQGHGIDTPEDVDSFVSRL